MNNSAWLIVFILATVMGGLFGKVAEAAKSCLGLAAGATVSMTFFCLAVVAGGRITWWM